MTTKHLTPKIAPDALEVLAAVAPLAPVAWTSAAWTDTMTGLCGAAADFMAARVKEDLETRKALMQCKSLAEVQHVQTAHLQKAFAQYQAETGRMIAMTSKLAIDLKAVPATAAQ